MSKTRSVKLSTEERRSLGLRIKWRLTDLGMLEKELAEKTGINSCLISGYCTGNRQPDDAKLQSIANVLGISFEHLLFGTDDSSRTFYSAVHHTGKADLRLRLEKEWNSLTLPEKKLTLESAMPYIYYMRAVSPESITLEQISHFFRQRL